MSFKKEMRTPKGPGGIHAIESIKIRPGKEIGLLVTRSTFFDEESTEPLERGVSVTVDMSKIKKPLDTFLKALEKAIVESDNELSGAEIV
jgi:hypothetical protein